MTDQQILAVAMHKAFGAPVNEWEIYNQCPAHSIESDERCIYTNIFSHKFAKAFWGKEKVSLSEPPFPLYLNEYEIDMPTWKYHLQQMVLCKEPLKYIEKFL